MKKIVFTIHSLQAGGMERVVSELANQFTKYKSLDVHIILYGIRREVFYKLDENVQIHKPNFEFNNKKRFISTVKTILYLRKQLTQLNPDTVLSFGEYWNNLVLLSTIGLKFPVYIADRSTPLKDLGKLQNYLRRQLYPKAAGLIVQTKTAKEMYEKQFKNINIKAIGNPIREMNNKENIKRENIILSVGRLINTKHHDRLIRIFSKIEDPSWKLVLVGDDAQKQNNKEKLVQLIEKLNLKGRVILTGKQKDVGRYYLRSKIFAFTSSSEGFPNVIGEAMSAGLPVVAYDCIAGPSEIIANNEDGFLIPLFEDQLFLDKLNLLIHDEDLRVRMRNKAQENIKRFDSKQISDKFLDVILNKKGI